MDLHGKIVNLECVCTAMGTDVTHQVAYATGHSDARHAAAELVQEFITEMIKSRDPMADIAAHRLDAVGYKALFHTAMRDLAAINRCLELDPDDGGAEPIISAIQKLKKDAARYQWLKKNKAHNNTHVWHFQKGVLLSGLLTLDASIDDRLEKDI